MNGAEEARLQREQLDKYLAWVQEEGGVEGPTRLMTMFTPEQELRMNWLRERCSGRILELGCCYGLVLAYCHGHIGVDSNEKSIALAEVLNPGATFVHGDFRQLQFPDKSVDTVMIPDCLEHIPWDDVPQVINEALRLARQRVLITLPNSNAKMVAGSFKHQWRCTMAKLDELLQLLRPVMHEVTPYFILIHKEL